MKNIKKTGLVSFLVITSILAIGIAGEADVIDNNQNDNLYFQEKSDNVVQPQLFDAEITFYLWEGDGCACEPIDGASFFAVGGEGNDSGSSDADGKCVLNLVINSEYRIYIEAEKFQRIIFDMEVVDDQTFNFHMKESKTNSFEYHSPLFQFITRLINTLIL
jgi:hypothetical protein